MDVVERVVSVWRRRGLGVNPGASERELARLEAHLGVPLPADIRLYFSLANGMHDTEMDQGCLSFWSIERIFAESVELDASYPRAEPVDLAFADELICSWFLWLRPRPTGSVGVFVEGERLELPSLTAFFEAYEASPGSLGLLT